MKQMLDLGYLFLFGMKTGKNGDCLIPECFAGKEDAGLRKITGFQTDRSLYITGVRRNLPGYNLHQGCFTAAVGAYQADSIGITDMPGGIIKNHLVAKSAV
jgi:hypothetical protein